MNHVANRAAHQLVGDYSVGSTMKSKSLRLGRAFAMLGFVACSHAPNQEEVVGAWSGPNGADLHLLGDGTFAARLLPREGLFPPGFPPSSVDGSGTRTLEKESASWVVRLSLTAVAQGDASVAVSLLIGRQSDCIYLYQWIREEGGRRHKFRKRGYTCSEAD